MGKIKGSRAERELLHMFFKTNKFVAVRVAGSGSVPLPSLDLLVGGKGRVLAIECKSIKKGGRYLDNEQIEQLRWFSEKFGAEAWIAVRFNIKGWYFLKLKDLGISKKGTYFVSLDICEKKSLRFEDLIKGVKKCR